MININRVSLVSFLFVFSENCSANCFKSGESYRVDNDVVLDTATRLTWQRCSFGQSLSSEGVCEGQALKLNYQQAKEIEHSLQGYWRLPSKQELKSLVDSSCGVPTINPIFSNTEPTWYWADGYPRNEDIGFVSFETGILAWGLNEKFEFNLRLVKAE